MERGRELAEHVRVFADQLEEGRSPGRQGDRVDQREFAVSSAVEQVGAEGNGAAEVVRDHHWVRQPPCAGPTWLPEERTPYCHR